MIVHWNGSVVFKLGLATSSIVLFVTLLQVTVGLQIVRLSSTQASINLTSVPLLQETQSFARLTTSVLSQTALLENDLTTEELESLKTEYRQSERQVDRVLEAISTNSLVARKATAFQTSQENFREVNESLFANQFEQRAQEQRIQHAKTALQGLAHDLKDHIDQLMIQSTTDILGQSKKDTDGNAHVRDQDFLNFVGEFEVLNSLKSSVANLTSMLDHVSLEQNVDDLSNNLRFQLRGIAQSLTLLPASQLRAEMAQTASDIVRRLDQNNGMIVLLKLNLTARTRFAELRVLQTAAIDEIHQRTDQIVNVAKETFERDVNGASQIASTLVWIGVATTLLVLGGIFAINRLVIKRQISDRFTKLTEDVVAISQGDYSRQIRVGGQDEIGVIASALDFFKGQASELQRSNEELEKFAYVAAHDLRSPLDAIQDLARWTLEDERDHLSTNCIVNLELLIKRSLRLSALQSDLLTYAKVGQIDTAAESISLDDEVSRISDLLDPDSHFKITLVNDPGKIEIYGMPTRQILLNLITNAIKHHDKDRGEITVRYESRANVHRLYVEDDGPGIEPRFQSKVFELFETLQSRDNIEGSGLGLALVSKLIDRLGGCITIHSNAPKERGCTFIFEIADLRQRKNTAA